MAIKKYHVSKNLLNKSGAVNGYLDSNNNFTSPHGDLYTTDYLNIPTGATTLTQSYEGNGMLVPAMCFYDSSKNFISGESFQGALTKTFQVPTNAAYFRTCYRVNFVWCMVNTGSTALPYEAYYTPYFADIPYRKFETATDTITTLPKTIIGDGQSASAIIKGNLTQSGTPTPSAPIYPQECGDKTANLSPPLSQWVDGYVNNSGNISQQGETVKEKSSNYIEINSNTDYTFSYETGDFPEGSSAGWRTIASYDSTQTFIERVSSAASSGKTPLTYHTPNNAKYIRLSFRTFGEQGNAMLNTGSTALPYEPYGYKIPISSANTTTPVYLGEVQSIRKIKKLVFNGTENWQKATNFLYLSGLSRSSVADCLCTHYKGTNSGTNYTCTMAGNIIRVYDSSYSTAEDFKTYLAQQYANGTPVTVWYVLSTPTTGIVNEPIRKIGAYSDSVTGTGIPTTGTAETFDVNTTLKPSEVQLTYHGWHEHSDTVFSNQ